MKAIKHLLLIALTILFYHFVLIPFAISSELKNSENQPVAKEEQKKVFGLGEIVVTGEKIENFIRKNPSQIVSISEQEIEQRNFLQVYDVLGSMSGVDVKPSSSGLGARISIRGGGGSGTVLVLIDGRPVNTMQYGGIDLSSIPVDIVKKITVFKPPVPVWLGPGSSAGAIYIETKQAGFTKKADLKGRLRVSAGSYGTADISGTSQWVGKTNDLMISGGASHKDGKRVNSQKNQGRLSIHYGKKADLFDYQINSMMFLSNHGVSGPDYNPTPNARQKYKKASFDIKIKGIASELIDYDTKIYLDGKRLEDTSNNGDHSNLSALTTGIRSDFFFEDSSETKEVRFGSLFETNHIDHTSTGKHHRNLISLNGVYTCRYSPLTMTAGFRSDYTNDFHYSPGANAGISWIISDKTTFKSGVGYSENIPSFGKLYQPSHGSIDQVRGNPNLDKERIISLSSGLHHTFENKNELIVSVFRTDTLDLIQYQRGADLISRPENIDKAWKQGLEANLKFHLSNVIDLDINYIWQKTKNKSNNKKLSYSPAHSLKTVLKATTCFKTRIEITGRAYSEQFTDILNDDSTKLNSYFTCDAKIIHPFSVFSNKADFFIHFHNLFNKKFSSHYGYPDDGFKFQSGVNINF